MKAILSLIHSTTCISCEMNRKLIRTLFAGFSAEKGSAPGQGSSMEVGSSATMNSGSCQVPWLLQPSELSPLFPDIGKAVLRSGKLLSSRTRPLSRLFHRSVEPQGRQQHHRPHPRVQAGFRVLKDDLHSRPEAFKELPLKPEMSCSSKVPCRKLVQEASKPFFQVWIFHSRFFRQDRGFPFLNLKRPHQPPCRPLLNSPE